ncbi:MAG: class I SAM-dependent methyltransferase [Betaproteobacteria bacterium]|nr:class I SAM-dependent methyltransferase [Betaproteobacteria bacterium]
MKSGAALRYTREHPSPRYRRLLRQYRRMHEVGEVHLGIAPERTFPGVSLPPQAPHIKRLIEMTGAKTLLDYGAGKGQQYLAQPIADETGQMHRGIAAWWGVTVRCFDPGYAPFSALPGEEFDGVISTDVLEHCPEEDLPWILGEMFSHARKFLFASVACYPAGKHLPNGQNAHCAIKPPEWWRPLIEAGAATRPGLLYEFRFAVNERRATGETRVEKVLTNASLNFA